MLQVQSHKNVSYTKFKYKSTTSTKENTIKNDTNLFWIMNMCPPHNEGNEGTDTVDDTR